MKKYIKPCISYENLELNNVMEKSTLKVTSDNTITSGNWDPPIICKNDSK